ncbi:MAG: hypothetical protein HY690_19055, partial [Chloroflexi bacterium]|nr:hypothetical protein [Chloroflexota bacterium]
MRVPPHLIPSAPLSTAVLLALVVLASVVVNAPGLSAQSFPPDDPRYFPQTGVRIDDDRFWDYFQHRGGARTFGLPVSQTFQLLGTRVQVFQRHVLQLRPEGSVGVLNLLTQDVLPYTHVNGSTLPPVDPGYVAQAPLAVDLEAALAFVQARVPDVWEGEPVGFLAAFFGTVRYEEAFPEGDGEPGLLPGFALELWGLPTSPPTRDPRNNAFIYQRFQRGIMHHDASTGQTQALLLADQLKALLTGVNLPPDLEAEARGSRFYRQYRPDGPLGLARPLELPGTNLLGAFPGLSAAPSLVLVPPPGGAPIPAAPPLPGTPPAPGPAPALAAP